MNSFDLANIIVKLNNQPKLTIQAKVLTTLETPQFLIGEIGNTPEGYERIYVRRFNSSRTRPIWVNHEEGYGYARQRVDTMYVVKFPIRSDMEIEEFAIQLGLSVEAFRRLS